MAWDSSTQQLRGDEVIDTLDSYRFRTSYWAHKLFRRRRTAYRRFDRSLPLFVRVGDVISEDVIANGVYEPAIKALIDRLRDAGQDDFFVDIGANIGLTSCQSAAGFKEVHLYEPNPDCAAILRVNLKLSLGATPWTLHDVGLGREDGTLRLFVPRGNWGGAFVKGADNAYSDELLARKDGFERFDRTNYDESEIRIKAAGDEMRRLFAAFAAKGLTRGVVKIDVEGYEFVVIEAILAALPDRFDLVVVFENWADIDPPPFLARFAGSHRLRVKKLLRDKNPLRSAPAWLNSVCNALRGGFDTTLIDAAGRWGEGTYVLGLTPLAAPLTRTAASAPDG